MKVRQPAQEYLLIKRDPPPKEGLVLRVDVKETHTGSVLRVGHKAAEEGYEHGQRIVWAPNVPMLRVEKLEDGDLILLNVENVRAVIE